jgi:hypothetical protein
VGSVFLGARDTADVGLVDSGAMNDESSTVVRKEPLRAGPT